MDIDLRPLGVKDLTAQEAGYLFALYTGIRDGREPEYEIRPPQYGVPRVRVDAKLTPDDVTILVFMYNQQKEREGGTDGVEQRAAAKAVAAYLRFKSTPPGDLQRRIPLSEESVRELQERRMAGDSEAIEILTEMALGVYRTFLDDVQEEV